MSTGNLEQLIQNGAIQINHKFISLSLLRIIFPSFGHEKREGMGGFTSEKRDEKRIIEWFSGGGGGQLNQARERRKVKEMIRENKGFEKGWEG